MVVAILLSFLPALFLALGQIYKVRGVKTFSIVYLAFIRATPPILFNFILLLLFIVYTLQWLDQSSYSYFCRYHGLVMRAAAGLFLVDAFGYIGACWANPMAWIGSCVPLMITFYNYKKVFVEKVL